MLDKKVKDSLSFRFLLLISGIFLVGTAVISLIVGINERKMLKRILTSKGQVLATYIAKQSQDPLIMKDYLQLDTIVNDANEDVDIVYAVIQDSQGKTVTSLYASINYQSPGVKSLVSSLPKYSQLSDVVGAIQKKEAVSIIAVPIMAGTDVIGKVSMGISEHTINQEIRKTITFIVAFNFAVMSALGTVFFIAFRRLIFNPITGLVLATTRLARGELTTKVESCGGGEIRILIDSFNQMADDLGVRTRELLDAQEDLVRKEKLAILGQLSGSVGHELRNPLGVMSNAVYFLKLVLPDADETTKEYLEIIKHEIDNSLRIITDLLDFARTRPPQWQLVTAEELVRQSLDRCSIPDNVTVTVDIPEALPRLNADPQQMGQVLTNFITNGVQSMKNGGPLSVSALLVDNDFVAISVADAGEGITPENMKKLFHPLFTTKVKGIGLGLVVCKNLVEANGGWIDVASEPWKGAKFTVTLPVETCLI